MSIEIMEFVEELTAWHENKVEQLQTIVDNKDMDIKVGENTIKADSDMACGVRFGVGVALELLGKLPFSISPVDD